MSNEHRIATLVEEIRSLTPAARGRLLRQLQVNGLLDEHETLTDRNALQVAPAVQRHRAGTDRIGGGLGRGAQGQDGSYRSSVRGRFVVGAPEAGDEVDDPHAMAPIPGLAPEKPIRLIFDGGSQGNPGRGYGSYALEWPGFSRQVVRLQFGERVTNNEAEYDTLIAALGAVEKRLRDANSDPATARIEAWGDSQLVINQVTGEWKCEKPELLVRRNEVRSLIEAFADVRLRYHSRDRNVEILGH